MNPLKTSESPTKVLYQVPRDQVRRQIYALTRLTLLKLSGQRRAASPHVALFHPKILILLLSSKLVFHFLPPSPPGAHWGNKALCVQFLAAACLNYIELANYLNVKLTSDSLITLAYNKAERHLELIME